MRPVYLLLAFLCFADAAGARPLIIVAEDYAPATFMENGELKGMDINVARKVFDRLGVDYEIKLLPWPRAWQMLKTGEADVGLHVSRTEERALSVNWPQNQVWTAEFVFMTNSETKAKYDLKNIEDVTRSKLRVGIINENAYHPNFWKAFPSPNRAGQEYNSQLEVANDAATNLRKLAANHIQLFPIARILGNYMAKEMHLHNVTSYDWVIFSKPYGNAFSLKSTFSDAKYANITQLMHDYDGELGRIKRDGAAYRDLLQYGD